MRQLGRWGYLLFQAVLLAFSIFYLRDLVIPTILLSNELGMAVYRRLVQHNQIKWVLPGGLVFAFLLGSLYYIANLLIFPHSPRAAHRLQDAYIMGPIFAFGGFLTAVWSSAGKRIAQDHAVNGTAIERRR